MMNPLYVDLDGSFVKTDLLYESLFSAVKRNPWIVLLIPLWLLRGKSELKKRLAALSTIDYGLLPVNTALQTFMADERKEGRSIILATASDRVHAESIVHCYPDLFDGWLASENGVNLKGKFKLEAIRGQTDAFDYVGNDIADRDILAVADHRYLANPSSSIERTHSDWDCIFLDQRSSLRAWLKQLRVHQALKNLLIFVPALLAPIDVMVAALPVTFLAFVSFSVLASATYVLNDLLDLDSDRRHPKKKYRPLASGDISIPASIVVMAVLLLISIGSAVFVGSGFLFVLLIYLVTTLTYSFVLKEYIGVDTIVLASLFTLRIFAGAQASNVSLSFWILAFSMLVFFSLALVKRCAELKMLELSGQEQASGRDYNIGDYSLLQSLGVSCGMLSVLVFAFYTQSTAFLDQYQQPTYIWLALPALSYWIIRMWMKTNRGEMHSDPIVFSITDRGSHVALGFVALMFVLERLV